MDWFRWHQGSTTDPKFQLVARKCGRSVAEVIAMWAVVLEAANAQELRGQHGNLDFESIDCQLGLQDGAAQDIYTALCDRGLVDKFQGLVKAWDKRQPRREREAVESSTDRVRRHRAKAAPVNESATETVGFDGDSPASSSLAFHGVTSDETPCNAMEHQKQPRGEERRREESNTSFSEQRVGAPPVNASPLAPPAAGSAKNSGADRSRQGTMLPADWSLPDPWRAFCASERPDLDPLAVAPRFADHWHSTPGAKGRKTDWFATWRNWVRGERVASGVVRQADIARATVPGRTGIDPELQRMNRERSTVGPPPAELRAKLFAKSNQPQSVGA